MHLPGALTFQAKAWLPSWMQPQPSKRVFPTHSLTAAPAPEYPGSRAAADRQEPRSQSTACHESMLQARASSCSWVHDSSGLLLSFQQHSCNIISNQFSGSPSQRDFCIVLLFLSQGATCWWCLSSSQLRQRENRAPVVVAGEPRDVQECGHISMASNAVTVLANAPEQSAKGSTRDQSLSQAGAGGECQSCHPSACPPGLKCTSLTLVLLAVDRKWKETENW